MKRFILVGALACALGAPGTASAVQEQVTLCHLADGPAQAGLITVAAPAAYHGHYLQHSADIIPPFTFAGQVYSLNWTGSFPEECFPGSTTGGTDGGTGTDGGGTTDGGTTGGGSTDGGSTDGGTTDGGTTGGTTGGGECQEDMPCWDCETMGNKRCGPDNPGGGGGTGGGAGGTTGGPHVTPTSSTLPYTGLPIWVPMLLAGALLVSGGMLLRKPVRAK